MAAVIEDCDSSHHGIIGNHLAAASVISDTLTSLVLAAFFGVFGAPTAVAPALAFFPPLLSELSEALLNSVKVVNLNDSFLEDDLMKLLVKNAV